MYCRDMTEPQAGYEKSNTSPDERRAQYEFYRQIPLGQKLRMVFDLYDMNRDLEMAGLRIQHSDATEEEIRHLWARQHLGVELYEQVYAGRAGFQPSK